MMARQGSKPWCVRERCAGKRRGEEGEEGGKKKKKKG